MAVWAGIDEAGYGPKLGPLVVAAAAFRLPRTPREGVLWEALAEAVTQQARGAVDRLVVYDSKKVYSPSAGLRRLEEGVLSFLHLLSGEAAGPAGRFLDLLQDGRPALEPAAPWFAATTDAHLPLSSNPSAVLSKADDLSRACTLGEIELIAMRAAVVFPAEFNRVVAHTKNKSLLLFQKCGLLLQEIRQMAGREPSWVLVDRHGGRSRYRRLLRDVFPDCPCDVLREGPGGSVYRIVDPGEPARVMHVAFKEKGDTLALPTALASMTAKYVRELHMKSFNEYWRQRLAGLKPTAGYAADARRFLKDVAPALEAEGVDMDAIVRMS
jgi:ribonuclease HII